VPVLRAGWCLRFGDLQRNELEARLARECK
jgi:hypothetical protein